MIDNVIMNYKWMLSCNGRIYNMYNGPWAYPWPVAMDHEEHEKFYSLHSISSCPLVVAYESG